MERYRAETFLTKEPETIAWINDMQPGEVLYDVGANVGVYTLYAASRGIRVVAIEPVLENYVRLVRNIEMNGFKNVVPLYGAAGPYSQVSRELYVRSMDAGASGGQIIAPIGQDGDEFTPQCERMIPIYSLDDNHLPLWMPQHIKIDVDGKEEYVLMGTIKILPAKALKSMLIEINPNQFSGMKVYFEIMGYTTDNKYNTMTPHSRERRQREGIAAENVIFTRR
jgi:FkbM family methyltransferase